MQMELLKKPIRSYRTIEIRETEEMLENSIIVPDSKPDIKNIILADAECFVTSVEKSGRMVEVGGEIKYRILYCSDTPDQSTESIVTQFTWSFSVPKPKTDAEIGIFAKSHSQHTEANAINGRKIVARTVCSLISRFYEIRTDEIGREILGENVYLQTTPVNVLSLKDCGDVVAKVSNVLSLPHGSPPMKEILFSRINVGSAELSYSEDDPCLEAKGTAYILYRSDTIDGSIESVVLEFPVKTVTGIQSVPSEIVFATSVLKSWELDALEDADGLLTQVSVNLELQVEAQALVPEEQVIIEDAYSIDYKLELKKTPINIVTDEREICDSLEINQKIKIDDPEDQLAEVLMVCANERNIASKINENSVAAQGTMGVDIVFMTSSRQVKSYFMEQPFSQMFNLPDEGQWQVVQSCFYIDDVSFDISGNDTIELSIKLNIKLRMSRFEEIVCTEDLTSIKEESRKKAPIILYFTHPGDTMWSIAKHYRIPLSRLALDNGLDVSENPQVGQKLFIM
ncbi:MAG: LysM peptidoglycan-binding domain-containing protein [Acetivibrionales bacterium]|jgi:hypothetical protein